jgi:hypothetical protein
MPITFKNNHLGLKIGIIFSLISFALTFTFLIPIFSVIPGSLIELISSYFVDKNSYSNVGKLTILILSGILILYLTIVLALIKNIAKKKSELKKSEIILMMFIFYFIVHPLGFYIYWAMFLNFANDGQLIFGAVTSFPYSSITFIILGIIMDFTWKQEFSRTEII